MKAAPMLDICSRFAKTRSEHPAVVGVGRSLTYAELWDRSNRVANALADIGVDEGGRVAYLDLNHPEFFELALGANKLGAAVAPLNYRLTPAELGQVVADSQAPILVVGSVFAATVETIRAVAPSLRGW